MLAIFFCFFLLASGFFVNKLILTTLSPSMLSGLRMLVSGLVLLVLNKKSYREGAFKRVRQHWKTFLAITLFTNFIPTLCKAYAIKNMVTSKAAFIGSIDPFITAFYMYVLFAETITIKKWIGILFGFAGALFLTTMSSPVEETLRAFMFFSLPEIAAIASVAMSRLGWILVQKKLRANEFSAVDMNGIVMTGGGLFAFLCIPLWQMMGFSESFDLVSKLDLRLTLLLLYTILIGNLCAYTLYAYLLKHTSSTLMSLAGFTFPVHVAILGYFILGEPLSPILLKAGAMMLFGVAIFYYDDIVSAMHVEKNTSSKGFFKK
jgi:drug/metabolite transporter (DMT)-like permease